MSFRCHLDKTRIYDDLSDGEVDRIVEEVLQLSQRAGQSMILVLSSKEGYIFEDTVSGRA